MSDQLENYIRDARDLVSVLNEIKSFGYNDAELLQRAKTLHARLAPVYRGLFGRFQLIWTAYPPRVWWTRAFEDATQALAALEGGMFRPPDEAQSGARQPQRQPVTGSAIAPDSPADLVCFVIAPIGSPHAQIGSEPRRAYEHSIRVWEQVIKPACDTVGLVPVRSDSLDRPGEITDQVFHFLRDADVVIADLTGGNPNVLYELGLRHTRNLLTLQLGEVDRLPFDINVIRTILFQRTEGGLIEARDRLAAALTAGLTGGYDPVTATRIWNETVSTQIDPMTMKPPADTNEEPPGLLDLVADAETGLEAASQALQRIAVVTDQLGTLAQASTQELERAAPRGAKTTLPIVARFAASLDAPTTEFEQLALQYETDMMAVAAGMNVLIGQLEDQPQRLGEASDLVSMIENLDEAATSGQTGLDAFAQGVASLEPISRSLRPTARRLRAAIERVASATRLVHEWRSRVDSLSSD